VPKNSNKQLARKSDK